MIHGIITSLITTAICYIAKNIYIAAKSQKRDKQEFSIIIVKKCTIVFWVTITTMILTFILKVKIASNLFLDSLFNVLFFLSAFFLFNAFEVIREMLYDIEKNKKDNS